MDAKLKLGDCLEVLRDLAPNSVDSLVTDPPAGIGFMGKDWDSDKGGSKRWIAWMTGRFPANLLLSHNPDCVTEDTFPRLGNAPLKCSLYCAVRMSDEQSGVLKSGARKEQDKSDSIFKMATTSPCDSDGR